METVSSRKNANVRFLRLFLREKNVRDEHGVFAVEGDHLCGELVRAGFKVTFAAFTEKAAEKYPETAALLKEKAEETIVITEELSEYISDTKSPQGLFAAAEIRGWAKSGQARVFSERARRVIVLDGVQDPGNVGTIIRTAEALGADGAVLLGGCADIWSPKTLRASMGSVFRLPVINAAAEELPKILDGFTVYGAMLDSTAKRLGEVKFPEKTAIVIGSEGSGVSDKVARLCGEKLYIPIKKAESLNAAAAAAVILWELSR
ncbi:MAG: RNA methyltransferase [Oscillospiraceae bacterium]|nr:RNA methyltransferase [Oscillospiraceae bacterium]